MDKVYQVFVSSTFSDLQEERKQVSDTLAKAGFIPAGMELFPATDQQQLEFIKRVIDRCDYYVVIIGGRYGSLDGEKSFTEKEYEYAAEKKIPILAFIHKEPGKIEADKTDRDPEQINRLEAFRSRLKTSRIVAFWTNVHDLRTEVLTAVTNAINLAPGIGWIRGDRAVDPKVLQEMERLRIENSELKNKLSQFDEEEIRFPANLMGPNDELEFTLELSHREKVNQDKVLSTERIKVTAPLGEIFLGLFDSILNEPSEYQLSRAIGRVLAHLAQKTDENTEYAIPGTEVTKLRYHFEALGLISAMGRAETMLRHQMHYVAWAITAKGRRFVAQQRAIYRPMTGPQVCPE